MDESLVFRTAGHVCAVALGAVNEVMRPLPVTPLAGMPSFVMGVSIIRAHPAPVVSVARLLADRGDRNGGDRHGGDRNGGDGAAAPGRFVTVCDRGGRTVALAVDEVLGVRRLAPGDLARTSPLLGALSREVVTAMGTLDAESLCVLGAARLVPEPVWDSLPRDGDGT